jgi:hypothetical protein
MSDLLFLGQNTAAYPTSILAAIIPAFPTTITTMANKTINIGQPTQWQ